jgi:hypothetical protein
VASWRDTSRAAGAGCRSKAKLSQQTRSCLILLYRCFFGLSHRHGCFPAGSTLRKPKVAYSCTSNPHKQVRRFNIEAFHVYLREDYDKSDALQERGRRFMDRAGWLLTGGLFFLMLFGSINVGVSNNAAPVREISSGRSQPGTAHQGNVPPHPSDDQPDPAKQADDRAGPAAESAADVSAHPSDRTSGQSAQEVRQP